MTLTLHMHVIFIRVRFDIYHLLLTFSFRYPRYLFQFPPMISTNKLISCYGNLGNFFIWQKSCLEIQPRRVVSVYILKFQNSLIWNKIGRNQCFWARIFCRKSENRQIGESKDDLNCHIANKVDNHGYILSKVQTPFRHGHTASKLFS